MVLTESPVPRTTLGRISLGRLHQTTEKGFTLIEIMIVLALVSFIMSVGMPAISGLTYQRVTSTTRKFTGVLKTIRNDTVLLNSIQRLAIDFEKRTWWVETQKRMELLGEAEDPKYKKKSKKDEEPVDSNFQLNPKYGKGPNELPGGVVFDGILKEREGLLKQGVAYIHFFPNGFVEQAILYLNKEGATEGGFSLIIRPTGGVIDIKRERVKSFEGLQ